jgi:hypothetical protein
MAAMKTSKPIQIFKSGKHTAMSGAALSFSETDLAATAAAYDPAKHEAPIVVGHPSNDGPAYGWVNSLSFADGGLDASPTQVNPEFAEMVKNGAYKKISAAFYAPDSPSNPVPGVYYLRHVGFLGAQPPAVKGMRNPSFAEKEEGVIEFAECGDVQNASLWRIFKNYWIGEKGLDAANIAIPEDAIVSLEQAAQQDDDTDTDTNTGTGAASPSFTEKPPIKGDEMSAEQLAELAALKAENTKNKADLAAFSEKEKTRAIAARLADHTAFVDGLIKEGRLLPANKGVTVATMDNITSQDQAVEFGEGETKTLLIDAYKAQLKAAPVIVNFSEIASGEAGASTGSAFATPRGCQVDQEKLLTHKKALEYAEKNNCEYLTAVKAVE